MSNITWIGSAPAIAQVSTLVVGGTPAVGQVYSVFMGLNSAKVVSYAALGGDTNITIAAALQLLLSASTFGEFAEVTWANTASSAVITGTAIAAGVPFSSTSSATGTGTLVTTPGIANPTISSTSTATTGGTLADATEFFYTLTALNACGETAQSAEVNRTTGSSAGTNTITLNWSAPAGTGITGYKIYGRATTSAEQYITTVGPAATSYVDTGSISPSGAPPTANTTVSSGPNDISCRGNYSGNLLPVNSDSFYLTNSSQGLLYNLNVLSGVTLALMQVDTTFTGAIGLPAYNANGYQEYRPQKLAVGATLLNYLPGTGGGNGFHQITLGSVQTTANLAVAAQPTVQGRPALLIEGTNASNTLTVTQGNVASAIDPGVISTWATVRIGYQTQVNSDVQLNLGPDCTLTTIVQDGGQATVQAAFTTWTVNAGSAVVLGSGAGTTLDNEAGSISYEGTGTITTLTVGEAATFDKSADPRTMTVTNCTCYGTINDPNKVITFTNPISVPLGLANSSGGVGAVINWGTKFSVQRS